MKRKFKIITIFLASIILLSCIATIIYADNSEVVVVKNWSALKSAIENSSNSVIKIQLSNDESKNWTADSIITISANKKVTIEAYSSITITRANTFAGAFIENNGSLDITTPQNSINVTMDGNRDNIKAKGSLIYTNSGVLNLSNVVLTNNNTSGKGGAIYASVSKLNISNVTLSGNESQIGGAIYVSDISSETILENVKILNNIANNGSGGGIYAYGNLIVSGKDTLIDSNTAELFGGGIMSKTSCTLNGGTISNNIAKQSDGGGIRCDIKITYNDGIIKGNSAGRHGGGLDFSPGILYGEGYEDKIINNTAVEGGDNYYPDLVNNVDWTKDENLKIRKVNLNLLKDYIRGTDIAADRGTQGMTVTDKYIVFALWKSNDTDTIIVIVDKNTGELLNVVDGFNYGHANDMAYDSKRDEVYVTSNNRQKIG